MVNTFTTTGRLAGDATLTQTTGNSVSNFRITCESGHGKHQKTLWIECSLWGPKANVLTQHLVKGRYVNVTGEISIRDTQRNDGSKGVGLILNVDRIEFVGNQKKLDMQGQDRSQNQGNFRRGGGRDFNFRRFNS